MQFEDLFCAATGFGEPFPYQRRLGLDGPLPQVVRVPTGMGKTEGVVLAWLWRRRYAAPEVQRQTPRRLVYCLPMRVLVEQTRDRIRGMLQRLGLLAQEPGLGDGIAVSCLMGGEDEDPWYDWPERDAILVGTQDMLLSRALNRGYAMSRFRWPVAFGLLNEDCLWVMDEVQLMGAGLSTTIQLQAFRDRLGTFCGCKSLWMSATVDPEALLTVDSPSRSAPFEVGLTDRTRCATILNARKAVELRKSDPGKPEVLAATVLDSHIRGQLTLVVVNTVERAQSIFRELRKQCRPSSRASDAPDLRLVHSRFRPAERESWTSFLGRDAQLPPSGRVIVSTQVVEAGVDISAAVLFTDLAPWPSLVQRFGRCNRRGEHKDARVVVLDTERAEPYDEAAVNTARDILRTLEDASPASLDTVAYRAPRMNTTTSVLRYTDLMDLFDTTPDLAGNDIDVSRFIREGVHADVYLCWRESGPEDGILAHVPSHDELCPVPLAQARDFLRKLERRSQGQPVAWRFDYLDGRWNPVHAGTLSPGMEIVVLSAAGGYSPELGFAPSVAEAVPQAFFGQRPPRTEEGHGDDRQSVGSYLSIAEHTQHVLQYLSRVLPATSPMTQEARDALRLAAIWHDRGKAHEVFQQRIIREGATDVSATRQDLAKAPERCWAASYKRKYFRHELASALAALAAGLSDLAVYLVASHHGRVRLLLRSMPDETRPESPGKRFCRGIWDGDVLPETDLGDGVIAPEVELSLEVSEIGLGVDGRPSWVDRMTRLRDEWGPFRLAYLEAILRAADRRASAAEVSAGTMPDEEEDHV